MGITFFAQAHLGDIVHIELPKLNAQVAKGKSMVPFSDKWLQGGLESVKAVSEIFAPLSGQILKVNEALKNDPGIINKSAEKDGWIAEISVSNPKEFGNSNWNNSIEQLLDADAYEKHCEEHKEEH